jgi:hypothetical protein
MQILEQHRDLEAGRAMLGHTRIDTTQTYAQIRPAPLERTVEFYERRGWIPTEQLDELDVEELAALHAHVSRTIERVSEAGSRRNRSPHHPRVKVTSLG